MTGLYLLWVLFIRPLVWLRWLFGVYRCKHCEVRVSWANARNEEWRDYVRGVLKTHSVWSDRYTVREVREYLDRVGPCELTFQEPPHHRVSTDKGARS